MYCFSGEWGGDGTKSTPDYGGAMNLAVIIKECFNAENEYVETDSTNTRAKIYGFDIVQMPSRMNEVTTGLGRYDFGIAMVYRAV